MSQRSNGKKHENTNKANDEKKDQVKNIKYKEDPDKYKHLDLSKKNLEKLMDNMIEGVMIDMGIVWPETDEEVEAILNGTRVRPQRHPDTYYLTEDQEVDNGKEEDEDELET